MGKQTSSLPIAFNQKLRALEYRVEQILSYHRLVPATVARDAIVAHFASWSACEAMLSAAAKRNENKKPRGAVLLWAGDANCLNDPLEGRALIKFAEDALVGRPPTVAPLALPLGGSPYWTSNPEGHLKAGFDLNRRTWRRLQTIARGLYGPPRASATGWYEPRPQPSSQVYLVSFCNDKDRLDLWRGYGDNGEGVSMVMPLVAATKAVQGTNWGFYRVMYGARQMRRALILLEKPLDAVWQESGELPIAIKPDARKKILSTVSPVLHLYKHSQFETENEIRLVYRGPSPKAKTASVKGELRPILETAPFFLGSSNCKVILGPRTPERSRRVASLQVLLTEVFPRHTPEVQISGVPYQ